LQIRVGRFDSGPRLQNTATTIAKKSEEEHTRCPALRGIFYGVAETWKAADELQNADIAGDVSSFHHMFWHRSEPALVQQ